MALESYLSLALPQLMQVHRGLGLLFFTSYYAILFHPVIVSQPATNR